MLEQRRLNKAQAHTLQIDALTGIELTGTEKGLRILCVDDDAIGLALRGEILTKHGYLVHLDNSPLKTLSRDLLAFDLAILDYEMPNLNGVELLLSMRSRRVTYPSGLLTGKLQCLSPSQIRLFDTCLDKGAPVEALLRIVDYHLRARGIPDPENEESPN